MTFRMFAFLYLGARAPVGRRVEFVGVKKCGSCERAFSADRLLVLLADPSSAIVGDHDLEARSFCGKCCRRMGVR